MRNWGKDMGMLFDICSRADSARSESARWDSCSLGTKVMLERTPSTVESVRVRVGYPTNRSVWA